MTAYAGINPPSTPNSTPGSRTRRCRDRSVGTNKPDTIQAQGAHHDLPNPPPDPPLQAAQAAAGQLTLPASGPKALDPRPQPRIHAHPRAAPTHGRPRRLPARTRRHHSRIHAPPTLTHACTPARAGYTHTSACPSTRSSPRPDLGPPNSPQLILVSRASRNPSAALLSPAPASACGRIPPHTQPVTQTPPIPTYPRTTGPAFTRAQRAGQAAAASPRAIPPRAAHRTPSPAATRPHAAYGCAAHPPSWRRVARSQPATAN